MGSLLAKPRSSAKAFRFDARMTRDQKLLIQRAADLEGRTLSEFVLQSAESAAERTIEQRSMLRLTAEEGRAVVEALLHPREPGPVLRKAASRYKKQIGR